MLEALRRGTRALERRTRTVTEQRQRILEAFAELGVEATASQANFVWMRSQGVDGAELSSRFARSGVIVRAGGTLGDARMVRAAIHDRESTDRFLRALTLATGGGGGDDH